MAHRSETLVYSGDIAEVLRTTFMVLANMILNLESGEGVSIKKLIEIMNEIVPFNYL